MTTSSIFKNVILIGSTSLLYGCAQIVERKYPDANIIVADIGDNLNQNFCDHFYTKAEIMNLLSGITEKTLVLSIMNRYLFPETVINNDALVMLNLHKALLPNHPGRNAEAWAIYEGDKKGGVTWHFITKEVDRGNIIIQKEIDISENDTSFKLLHKYDQLALEGLEEILPLEELDASSFIVQTGDERPKLHYSYERPNDGVLDLNWPVQKMIRFLNSMNYGKFLNLGEMEISFGGEKFHFTKYKIEPINDDKGDVTINEAKDTIKIKKQNTLITLKKLKKQLN